MKNGFVCFSRDEGAVSTIEPQPSSFPIWSWTRVTG